MRASWLRARGLALACVVLVAGCRAKLRVETPKADGAADVAANPALDYVDSVIKAPVYVDGPVPIPGDEPRAPMVIGKKGRPVLVTSVRPGSVFAFSHRDASPPTQGFIRRHRNRDDATSPERPLSIPLKASRVEGAKSAESIVAFDVPHLPTGVYDVWYEGGKPIAHPADGVEPTERPTPAASQWTTIEVRATLRAKSAVVRGKVGSLVDVAIGTDGARGDRAPVTITMFGFDQVAQLAPGQAASAVTGSDGFAHFALRIATRGDTYVYAKSPGHSSVAIRVVGGPVFERPDHRLQPGDVLECQGNRTVSDLIVMGERFELGSPNPLGRPWYSHVAIHLGNGEVAEMLDQGWVRRSLDESVVECTTVDVYRRNGVLPDQQAKIVESVRAYGEGASVPYAWKQVGVLGAAAAMGMNLDLALGPEGLLLCGITFGLTCEGQRIAHSVLRAGFLASMALYGAEDRGRERMICSELATWAYQDAGVAFDASPGWPDLANRGLLLDPVARIDFTTPNMISHSRDMDFVFQLWPPGPPAFVADDQILLGEQVTFDLGSAAIRKDAEELLRHVADLLRRHPEIAHVRIEGHTDDIGNENDNLRLSEKRAEAVRNWFAAHGIAADRLSSVGLGESRPLVPNDEEHNRRRNRRVEFHVVAKADR